MRICLVTREFPPLTSYTGGIGRAYAGLSRAFASDGHDVTVVVPGLHDGTTHYKGVDVRGVRDGGTGRPSAARHLATVLSVRRELRRRPEIEIVFAPDWFGDDAKLFGLGRSPSLHITNLTTSLKQIRAITADARRIGDLRPHRIAQSWLERAQTESADGVVACSRAILGWTSRLWRIGGKPTAVIPNGIDVEWVREVSAKRAPGIFPARCPTILFAGRLEAKKGVTVLTEAMLTVWRSRPDALLVFVGRDGAWKGRPMSERIAEIAGDHAKRLVFLGEQPPENLFPALAAADVVALPSIWENLSLTGLEALAAGASLVATRRTGFEDVIRDGENGLLVDPGDAGALASALLALLENAALRRRLSTAALQASREFDTSSVARRHVEFFEEVVDRRGHAASRARG